MKELGAPALLLIFIGAAIATWIAGVRLAKATDVLDDRFGLGEAIGGMILLSIAGSLPELAITVSAALGGHLDIAAGNLIGGVAVQTIVLAIADRFVRGPLPLAAAAASLVPALEGLLVVAVVAVTAMSGLLPASAAVGPLGVGAIAIFVIWLVGMLVLNRCRDRTDLALAASSGSTKPAMNSAQATSATLPSKKASTGSAILTFVIASLVTLVAGVLLEPSGDRLADLAGINGVLFGATFLALATALPEISTAITGVRMQSYTLVFGDIFGGNAFQLTLFLLADLLAMQPVLPHEGHANAWVGLLGLLLTAVYVTALLLRPQKRLGGLGVESWLALGGYALGIRGLMLIAR